MANGVLAGLEGVVHRVVVFLHFVITIPFSGEVVSREVRHDRKWPGNREELRKVLVCSKRSPRYT